jgi:hypothetical protein
MISMFLITQTMLQKYSELGILSHQLFQRLFFLILFNFLHNLFDLLLVAVGCAHSHYNLLTSSSICISNILTH